MAPRRCSLLGALCALLLAGCGGEENPRRIAQGDADALLATIDGIRSAIDDGDCRVAERGVEEARRQVAELPRRTAVSLRENLTEWVDQVGERVPRDCEEEPEETPTPEETPEETTTPEPSAPEDEETPTPEPTPDDTATPTPTEAPAPEEPEPDVPTTPEDVVPDADDGTGGAAAP